jgi:hypothetical protein
VVLVIAWLMASAFNKASISDMDMDPEQNEYTGEDEVNTTDGSYALGNAD